MTKNTLVSITTEDLNFKYDSCTSNDNNDIFSGCNSLSSLPDLNINEYVIDINSMFSGISITNVHDLNVEITDVKL